MSLEKFITALQSLDLDPTAEELADVLWLTAQIYQVQMTTSELARTQPKGTISGHSSTDKQSSQAQPDVVQESSKVTQDVTDSVPVHTQRNTSDDLRLRIPAARYLPHSLQLARALRPLMQRVASRTHEQMDELATVERIAETHIWLPVVRGIPERHFDLVLIVEDSPSMKVWNPMIAEFRKLLENQGAFRRVQMWKMEHVSGNVQLSHSKKELIDPTQRRLILIVSDCISEGWYTGKILEILMSWERHHPIALVQMLPQRMWRGTGLSQALRVNFRANPANLLNSKLKHDAAEFWLEDDIPKGLKMTVITLESHSLGYWAKLVAGRGHDWVTGVIFEPIEQLKENSSSQESIPVPMTAKDRMNRFFAMASPPAQELARYLAAAPLSLEVMRLVQQTMLPKSEQVHLAEVFLGGLLKQEKSCLTEYDFHDGVRELLLQKVLKLEKEQVVEAVSDFLSKRFGHVSDFRAWLPNSAINFENRPFAQIPVKLLRQLGGKYQDLADKIEQYCSRTVDIEKPIPTVIAPTPAPEEKSVGTKRHVIYVSYADADEEWVIHFVNGLKVYLRRNIGEIDDNFIWAKYMLRGIDNRSKVPQQHLQQSRYLLTVLSPAYLKTMGDSEINLFKNVDNIFVVECGKTDRPEKLKSFNGYQFWHEDKVGNVVRWTDPEPLPNEREYYRLLDQMARDIAKTIYEPKYYRLLDQMARDIAKMIHEPKQVVSDTRVQSSFDIYEPQPIARVFIHATEEDRAVALSIQKHLNGNIVSSTSLLPSSAVGLSPRELQKELEKNLLNCDAVIIICDQAPVTWVYQQIRFILRVRLKRQKAMKPDIKVVVVNKPPPDNLEKFLSFQSPNLRVLNCVEISDCVSNITKVVLSVEKSEDTPSMQPFLSPQCIVVTVTDTEESAFRDVLKEQNIELVFQKHEHLGYYNRFFLQNQHCALIRPIEKGRQASQTLVNKLLRYPPQLIIMMGICGGFNERGVKLNDVIFAHSIIDYERERLTDDEYRAGIKSQQYRTNPHLLELIANFKTELAQELKIRIHHEKILASGDKLLASREHELRQKILDIHSDIYGIEMEGSGFYRAVHDAQIPDLDVTVIKAVSDLGDEQMAKGKEKKQQKAAKIAAQVTLKVIEQYFAS